MKFIILILFCVISVYAQEVSTMTKDIEVCRMITTKSNESGDFTCYISSKIASWRFVHDGKNLLIPPFFDSGETSSKNIIVECKTFELAIDEIGRLKLAIDEEIAKKIAFDMIKFKIVK